MSAPVAPPRDASNEDVPEIQLLGPGARFEGLLHFRGAARIEGDLQGEVLAEGRLHVGAGARIRAAIAVDEIVVAGEIEGDIKARHSATLLPTARVTGDLETPRLDIREGGVLDGRCTAGGNDLLP